MTKKEDVEICSVCHRDVDGRLVRYADNGEAVCQSCIIYCEDCGGCKCYTCEDWADDCDCDERCDCGAKLTITTRKDIQLFTHKKKGNKMTTEQIKEEIKNYIAVNDIFIDSIKEYEDVLLVNGEFYFTSEQLVNADLLPAKYKDEWKSPYDNIYDIPEDYYFISDRSSLLDIVAQTLESEIAAGDNTRIRNWAKVFGYLYDMEDFDYGYIDDYYDVQVINDYEEYISGYFS